MTKMKPGDPAYWMLSDGVESTPTVYNPTCYICNDPEFAQMGLPLCYACLICGAHVPADDIECDNGHMNPTDPIEELQIRKEHNLDITWDLRQKAKEMMDHDVDAGLDDMIRTQKGE